MEIRSSTIHVTKTTSGEERVVVDIADYAGEERCYKTGGSQHLVLTDVNIYSHYRAMMELSPHTYSEVA